VVELTEEKRRQHRLHLHAPKERRRLGNRVWVSGSCRCVGGGDRMEEVCRGQQEREAAR
jgi:hypothetical protein